MVGQGPFNIALVGLLVGIPIILSAMFEDPVSWFFTALFVVLIVPMTLALTLE